MCMCVDDIVGISCFVYGSNFVVCVPTFVMNSGHKNVPKVGFGLDFELFHFL